MPTLAYLSLGSNLGNRSEQLRQAIGRLESVGHVVRISSCYETEPVEFTGQPWFLNCALALETDLAVEELMREILRIERGLDRVRLQNKGPRTIDIDILLFGNAVMNSTSLTLPHAAMAQRRFVLEPLAEIAPDVRHPILKKTAQELLKELPEGPVVRKIEARALDRFTER